MTLSLIVAIAENGVIGRDNALPWHIPEDLRYFKQVTLGKPVIMGRKTYESIGRPLPGRHNIVMTRDRTWSADGVTIARTDQEALAAAGESEVFVIGGNTLFQSFLPQADRLYVTEIHRAYEGDITFPPWDRRMWRETARRKVDSDPAISVVLYEKLRK